MIETNNVKNNIDRYLQNFFSITNNIRKKFIFEIHIWYK